MKSHITPEIAEASNLQCIEYPKELWEYITAYPQWYLTFEKNAWIDWLYPENTVKLPLSEKILSDVALTTTLVASLSLMPFAMGGYALGVLYMPIGFVYGGMVDISNSLTPKQSVHGFFSKNNQNEKREMGSHSNPTFSF